jgi:hypothetical protein
MGSAGLGEVATSAAPAPAAITRTGPTAGLALSATALPATPGYGGALVQSVNFAHLGVQLDPPPASVSPRISWQSANGLCASHLAVCGDYNIAPHITLALVSTDNGATINPDGSLTRTVNNELTYVMTWSALPCGPYAGGPYIPPGIVRPTPPATSCFFMTLVDANTGKFLGAGQSSGVGGP